MARYQFVDEEVTMNELPKEKSREKSSTSNRYQFVDTPVAPTQDWSKELARIIPDFSEIPALSFRGGSKGFLGAYGNLLDLAGLQKQGTAQGEEELNKFEHGASDIQLAASSEADEPVPRYTSLPTGEQVGKGIEFLGGPGEAKTPLGRYASRISEIAGGGAAMGSPQARLAVAAGTIGQSLEELGAPKWLQAAGEIATFLSGSRAKTLVSSNSKELSSELDRLRKLGFSEKDLTLAKNALEDRGWLQKGAKYTNRAERKFKTVLKNSEENAKNIIESSIPGFKKTGTSEVKKAAEELFGSLDDIAKDTVISNPDSFVKNADSVINKLKSTLANTEKEKEVISLLKKAKKSAVSGKGAEVYTRFYKGLNQIGHWGNAKEREHILTATKDAIKQTFRDQGPQGHKLADALEEANKSWIKYLNAEDVSEIIAKASTEEGINFAKLSKALENPDHYQSMTKALGKESASNIKKIADTSKSIGNFEKKIIGTEAKKVLGGAKLTALAMAAVTGNIVPVQAYLGLEAASRLSTWFLIDPKFQNIKLKMMNAVKDQKWSTLRSLSQHLEKEIEANQIKDQKK